MSLLVNDTTPRVQYTATASQTTFAYPFEIFVDADLKVYQTLSGATPDDDTDVLVLTTDYTVTNAGVSGGGDIVLVTGAASGDVITIERDIAIERTSDYQNLGDLASSSLNDDLDKLVMMAQQNESHINNLCIKTQATSQAGSLDLPVLVNDKYLTTDGTSLIWGTPEGAAGAIGNLSEDITPQLGAALDTNDFQINQSKGADIASATALTLGTDGNYFDVTGTTAITSIGSVGIGTVVTLHFDGALTLTYNATDLILPGADDVTTAAGDEFTFVEYASGDWRCIGYVLANGQSIASPIINGTAQATTSGTSVTFTGIPSGTKIIRIMFYDVQPAASAALRVKVGDSGGVESTGYLGNVATITGTNTCQVGFGSVTTYFAVNAATNGSQNGVITLVNQGGNVWVSSGILHDRTNSYVNQSAGSKELSGEIDRVEISLTTSTFQLGEINIQYQ